MLRTMCNLVVGLLLMLGSSIAYAAAPLAPAPVATLTVLGSETPGDSGSFTIDFNGFVEAVHYGQFSTPASLASAFAAVFTRDYIAMGLYAKAGANNNTDPNVITFQLADGNTFAPVNIAGPGTSFSFSASGFANSSAATADLGTATLMFNGSPIATANYGDGSTGASIAQDLALKAGSPLVTVTSQGQTLYLQSKQTGTYTNAYSLTFSTSVSFSSNPSTGTLTSSTDAQPVTVYSYNAIYDPTGNVLGLADSVMGTWAYATSTGAGYDNLNRLTSAQASTGPYAGQYVCWSYDDFGNRTHQSISNQPFVNATGQPCQVASGATLLDTAVSYTPNNNQIASVSSPASVTVSYDGAGNVTNDGYNSYVYDAEGRICAVHGSYGMVGYQYDAEGNRIGKGMISTMSCDITSNGYSPTTDYVLDQGGGQMTEIAVGNGAQTWVHTNVTANGMLIATYDEAGLHFYLNDPLGSRRAQTDAAGFPEQTCQSLPFGDQLYCTGSLDSPTEHHFTGKERDAESGLDYFGARYFGSSMGRMMSPDPLGGQLTNPQSLNKYAYALNNPLINTDPTGMYVCQDSTKCDTDQDKAFEKSRQGDLKSKDANVVRGASSYGDPTKDNGVSVKFGDPGKGNDAITSHDLGADPNDPTKTRAVETVTVRSGLSGSGLDAAVGHEGSHVADAQDFAATINASGNFDASKNLSQYQTEFKAYMVTNSIMNSDGQQGSYGQCGGGPCTLGVSPRSAGNTINQLLANPANGYGVTPQNPGKLLYPSLTTPQKPQ